MNRSLLREVNAVPATQAFASEFIAMKVRDVDDEQTDIVEADIVKGFQRFTTWRRKVTYRVKCSTSVGHYGAPLAYMVN